MANMPQESKENILSHTQLFAILTRAMLGGVLFGVYRAVTEDVGRDSWISFILAGMVIILASLIIIALSRRFPGYTFVEYAQVIVGKPIGKILGAILVLYFLFICSVYLRLMGETTITWILPNTPLYIILILSLTVIFYMVRNGLLVLGRYCTLIVMMVTPLVILLFFPSPKWMISNILPIGQAGFLKIASGIIPCLFAYEGYEVLLMVFPYVKDEKKITRTTLIAVSYCIFIYTFMMVCILLFFGPKEIQFLLYPPMIYLETIEIALIERLDLLVFFLGLFSVSANIGIVYSMVSMGISQLFNIKGRKNVSLFIYPLLLIMALIPKNIVTIINFYALIGFLNIVIGMGIPLILLILSLLLRKKGENKDENT